MLKLQNISKYYKSNEVVALGLRKVNLQFELGEFVAVTGESGSGKSTLLNVISGLDSYEDGEMYVNGEETSYFSIEEWEAFRRQYIGFVFQSYNIIDSYSVLENVMIALTIQGYDKATRKDRALKLIDQVGLSSHVHHKASKLSGGQKQRCVIARALAKDCPIIVADEPTGNLDSESGKKVLSLLKEISKDKLVIVVTHSFDEISEYATRKIRLFDGEVVEDKEVRKPEEVEETNTVESYKMTWIDLIGISLRNLFRTPRRTIFTLIVSIFIVLVFTFSYGSYTSQTSGINTNFYFGIFRNVTESRIIVTKFGNEAFTPEDMLEIRDIDLVRTIVEDDLVLDLTVKVYIEDEYNSDWINYRESYINPSEMLNSSSLISGSFPSSKYEVVIEETDGFSVGDIIDIGFDYPDWDEGKQLVPSDSTEFIISGISKKTSSNTWMMRLYFHEEFISSDEALDNAYNGDDSKTALSIKYDDLQVGWLSPQYIVTDDGLANGEVEVSVDYLNELAVSVFPGFDFENDTVTVSMFDEIEFDLMSITNFETDTIPVKIVGTYVPEQDSNGNVSINTNTLDILLSEDKYQIAAIVLDAYDADQVITDLQTLGYNAVYPVSATNEITAILAIVQGIYLGSMIGFLMVVIYFISYIVLKNVQNSKKKDYLIFRSIGASKKDLNKVTILELFITTIIAYAITMSLLYVNEFFDTWIPQYLRYFTVGSYLFIFLLLSVLALFLGNRFNKKIFSTTVITSLKQE